MEALGLNLKWFLFDLGNFIVLLVVLNYFLHKPMLALLNKRREELVANAKQAEDIKDALAESEEKQRAMLSEAQTHAQTILEQAREQAKHLESRLQQEAKEHAERLLTQAKADIDLERNQMHAELKGELAGMVITATEKVLGQDIPDQIKQSSLKKDAEGVRV